MNIKRLEFLLTEKCNSRCIHCQGEHSPERQGVMKVEDGLNYLEETTSVAKLDSFMIFGGESMLYPERVIKLCQKAKELSIPEIELITNGFWGKNVDRARSLATQLKGSGVNEVLISVDAFHLPYLPLDYARNAALACAAAGIRRVRWNIAILESENASNDFDKQTRRIMEILAPLGMEKNVNKVWPQGRARRTLTEFFPKQSLEGKCPKVETALVNPTCVTMDSRGWASICWNLSIGNGKRQPLSKILIGYDWKNHPVIKTLVEHGPKGLLELPEASGFHFEENRYIDKCHLCKDIRKIVKPEYPEMFV
ncbi:MAG: radical SAM protein [Candidatus Bathyarchaeota archaeon]|nr:radical SAM protein [Candidatus Bathyarchaeota archaeon]